jgi:hypothetical protein
VDVYLQLEKLLDGDRNIQYIHNAVDTLDNPKASQTIPKTIFQEKIFCRKKFFNRKRNNLKRIFPLLISIFLIIVPVVSVSIISFPIHSNQTRISVSLNPENAHVNETMNVTVNIPICYQVNSVVADMGGLDLITLSLSDTCSDVEIWQTNWVVPSSNDSEYRAIITLTNETNGSIVLEKNWNILPDTIRENDNESGWSTNETPDPLHQSTNQTSDATNSSEIPIFINK